MIFDSNVCIAFKNYCGKYDVEEISLFDIKKIEKLYKGFYVKINKNREIVFKIECPVCGKYHVYNFVFNDFVNREIVMGGCNDLGMPLFFIGNHNKVQEIINKYINVNNDIYAMI